MSGKLISRAVLLGAALGLAWAPWAATQTVRPNLPPPRPVQTQPGTSSAPRLTPKLEPLAETRLLMEGLANSNFRGIEKLLRQQPGDVQTWTFARGQALLIAETANLLMLRPPRTAQAQPVWFQRTMDLRNSAKAVATAAAAQDFPRARTAFVNLANACNRCHQGFRVAVEIVPFQEAPGPKGVSLAP